MRVKSLKTNKENELARDHTHQASKHQNRITSLNMSCMIESNVCHYGSRRHYHKLVVLVFQMTSHTNIKILYQQYLAAKTMHVFVENLLGTQFAVVIHYHRHQCWTRWFDWEIWFSLCQLPCNFQFLIMIALVKGSLSRGTNGPGGASMGDKGVLTLQWMRWSRSFQTFLQVEEKSISPSILLHFSVL